MATEANTRELWLREILRVSREVAPRDAFFSKLVSRCPFDFSAAGFQTAIVERVLRDEQQRRFPPNRYQSAYFWRDIVAKIREKLSSSSSSSSGGEIHPDLLEREKNALTLAEANEEEDLTAGFYRNFELADACDATTTSRLEGETDSVVVLPSCPAERSHLYPFRVETGNMAASIGLVQWPAGFLMCEFALDQPEIFAGKRVLELGAGIGLTTTIIARHCRPAAIVATDFDVRALENIHHNFKNNGLATNEDLFTRPAESNPSTYTSSSIARLVDLRADPSAAASSSSAVAECAVHTAQVDWYHYSTSQIADFKADVIIACDTTYVEAILVPFAQTVHACLKANPHAVVYLAQAQRHPSTFLLYLDALRDEGLAVKELPTEHWNQRFNYDRTTCPVALHRVTL